MEMKELFSKIKYRLTPKVYKDRDRFRRNYFETLNTLLKIVSKNNELKDENTTLREHEISLMNRVAELEGSPFRVGPTRGVIANQAHASKQRIRDLEAQLLANGIEPQ